MDLYPYFQTVLEKKMSLTQLQQFLIEIWIDELCSVYDIKLPVTNDRFAEMIKAVREIVVERSRGMFYSGFVLLKNFGLARGLLKALSELSVADQLIMLAPFLTTIDSSVLNFTANPEPVRI